MTVQIAPMTQAELDRAVRPNEDGGIGILLTERGVLPLEALDVRAAITGLTSDTELSQTFRNAYDRPLEATYVFPLPDRAAVTGMRMEADGRTVVADLQERAAAREAYDTAIAEGKRAGIAEEERPDVFTMRVGNILPGERVAVRLTLAGRLPYEDGNATYRFPLVVAPRYVPGTPVPDAPVGDGWAWDTDAVPDASRISPPVLLPGFAAPVELSIEVAVDPAGLPLSGVRSSLHAVTVTDGVYAVRPGERADRDLVLRLDYASDGALGTALTLAPDEDGNEGTFLLTVLPPADAAPPRPRDVALVLDRSGSMGGWKMAAARRAAARIVDTLGPADRFAVLAFDDQIEYPTDVAPGLVDGADRNRYRAVEFLARLDARGGTELLEPVHDALDLLAGGEGRDAEVRDKVLVLVTDGQVGNEDQLLHALDLSGVRVHTVGIDRAVNAGFLSRFATLGGGRFELVESEDRLDEAMDAVHRRIGSPLVTGLTLAGLDLVEDTVSPRRLPDLFPGAPLVLSGRYRSTASTARLTGTAADGTPWSVDAAASAALDGSAGKALSAVWARGHLRDLEDAYVSGEAGEALEKRITDTSLRFGVLCRFTAYVAVDERVVTDGEAPHTVVQPVEAPSGWDLPMPAGRPAPLMARSRSAMAPMAMPAPSPAGPPPPGFSPATAYGSVSPVADMARESAPAVGGGGSYELAESVIARPAPKKQEEKADKRVARKPEPRPAGSGLDAFLTAELAVTRPADLPAYLAELAVRLRAVLDAHPGAPEELAALADDLESFDPADAEALWARTREVFQQAATPAERPFWKRR